MSGALLEVRDLRVSLSVPGGVLRAVDGVDLTLAPAETFALLGESGCGKSMTALSILRLLPAAGRVVGGSVRLDGTDLLRLPEHAMRTVRGGRIAMIFQEPQSSLNPVLTIGDQIAESVRRHQGLSARDAARRAVELLEAVGIPEADRRTHEYPHQLSGGMKQRAMIAIALAGQPELLIADEPTTALDVTIQAQVLELLGRLRRERGMAVLLITHDLGVVAESAQRVAVMYAGEIVEEGTTEALFARPLHPYTRKLFAALPGVGKRGGALEVIPGSVPPLTGELAGCRFAARCDQAWQQCRTTAPDWHAPGAGQRVRCHLYGAAAAVPAGPASGPVPEAPALGRDPAAAPCGLLSVRGLKVHFPIRRGLLQRVVGHVRAVDGVDLELAAGRTLALVGESGCGKTTVGKGILQLLRPTAGSVRFAGDELTRLRGQALRRRRRDIQIVFQDPYASMNPRMLVGDIVEEGMLAQGILPERDARRARVADLLGQVGLDPAAVDRYPHEFSGGQRQRVAIARALAVEPKLVVCDEPTSALDVSVQAQILNLIKGLQERFGLAYLFVSHNLAVVEYLAHEVAVMYLGRIVEHGRVDDVLRRPGHPYTRALLSAVPVPDPARRREVIRLEGELPSPSNPPRGCHFHPRCPEATAVCREVYPEAVAVGGGHRVACHLHGQP
ncbi:MAG: ABC transporter ATP-binding protein [Gammaproteobacteria bacterium]|nr:ABC transporter ATP-binding protein [Gammaproteobacteria bacterium]